MRVSLAFIAKAVALSAGSCLLAGAALAADLGERPWTSGPRQPLAYEGLWAGRSIDPGADVGPPGRPHRRVMGGPDYVGSTFGLGKPPVSGIGPRPDWGRSSYD